MSASVRINLDGVDDQQLTPGAYEVVVSEVEQKESANSDYDYLAWTLTIDEGPAEGRKLYLNTSLNPKAAFALRRSLLAVGFDDETISDPNGFDLQLDALIGARCVAQVKMGTYQGEERAQVDKIVRSEKTRAISGSSESAKPKRRSRG